MTNRPSPVQKALWLIETTLHGPISLEGVAASCDVSPFHLTRAFAAVTGLSLIRYVRARRLSEAAVLLTQGAPDILALALAAGYASHEAFTRAFREQFGCTPEQAREGGPATPLALTLPPALDIRPLVDVAQPTVEARAAFQIAGIAARHRQGDYAGLPHQWGRLAAHGMPGSRPWLYSARYNDDDPEWFDYLCGIQVAAHGDIPPEFQRLQIPAARYLIFRQSQHIATIGRVFAAIFMHWLPQSDHTLGTMPIIEHYPAAFDPFTGNGGFEIWLPLAA
jgi:AraC family transcriptional regulator